MLGTHWERSFSNVKEYICVCDDYKLGQIKLCTISHALQNIFFTLLNEYQWNFINFDSKKPFSGCNLERDVIFSKRGCSHIIFLIFIMFMFIFHSGLKKFTILIIFTIL